MMPEQPDQPRTDPDLEASELTVLSQFLDFHRATLVMKCAGLSDAVKATKLGAFHFLEKPLTPEGVLLTLRSAIELRRARLETRALREDLGPAGTMVGRAQLPSGGSRWSCATLRRQSEAVSNISSPRRTS